jgi:nitroreductase
MSRQTDDGALASRKIMSNADILSALQWRQSTKKFDSTRQISNEDFELILEAARLSPSSFGFEPWNLLVITDTDLLQAIRETAWGAEGKLPEASHFIVITAKTSAALEPHGEYLRHMLQGIRGYNAEEYADYIDNWFEPWARNDYGRFETPQLLHEWAARQAYIALANMMTVAALRGIDTCPIEGFNQGKVTKLLEQFAGLDTALDLPVVMLALGYRAEAARPKTRRPMSEIACKI